MKHKSEQKQGWRQKILVKLMLWLLSFSAIVLALLWLLQTVLLEPMYRFIKEQENMNTALYISSHLNDDDILDQLSVYSQDASVSILVETEDAQTIFATRFGRDTLDRFISPTIRQQVHTTVSKDNIPQYLDIDKPFFSGAKIGKDTLISVTRTIYQDQTAYVYVCSMMVPVSSTVQALQAQLLFVSVFLLLLVSIFAYLMARKVAVPISRLNDTAKQFSKGSYNVHFEESGYQEAAELADTLNKAAKELSKVENLRKELVANVSHDLRTPLTMISGYAEMMRDLPGENTPENMQVIIDEAQRMSRLISDILDVSKVSSGNMAFTKKPVCLTKLVRDVTDRCCKLVEAKGYTISFSSDRDVFVSGDETRLEQILYNLIGNAVNHTGEDQSVQIFQTVSDGSVTISVSDMGEGIPKEELPYIWDRYYKVDRSHRREQMGTGLGLSIVRGLVALHDGTCSVSSEVGVGSVFSFTLDILQETSYNQIHKAT